LRCRMGCKTFPRDVAWRGDNAMPRACASALAHTQRRITLLPATLRHVFYARALAARWRAERRLRRRAAQRLLPSPAKTTRLPVNSAQNGGTLRKNASCAYKATLRGRGDNFGTVTAGRYWRGNTAKPSTLCASWRGATPLIPYVPRVVACLLWLPATYQTISPISPGGATSGVVGVLAHLQTTSAVSSLPYR